MKSIGKQKPTVGYLSDLGDCLGDLVPNEIGGTNYFGITDYLPTTQNLSY